jgi:DNA repair photolyase
MFYTPVVRAAYREEPCRTALNRVRGMPFDWSLNPYMGCAHRCSFCYVRAFEQRADRPSGSAYGSSIRVKVNVVEVLARELARRSWRGDPVTIGAATDPYQPAEGRFRLTRGCLERLAAAANPFAVITRSPLIVRDLDVLTRAASSAEVSVAFSVPCLDEDVWRATEPGTAPPHQRLRALRRLAEAGIRTSVAIAPILPGISDGRDQLAAVVEAAREAGADGIWSGLLHLRPGTREHFLESLAELWPELVPAYEALYAGRAYLPRAEVEPIRAAVSALARASGVGESRARTLRPAPAPRQLSLEL